MFLAFAIMGWSFIILGSLFQIFIAVVSLIDSTFELPSFINDINIFSKKTILNQSYLSSNYGESYMTFLIPSLLILVAISVFAVSVYELLRIKKGQLLAKPYVKIYFIVLIVVSLVYGRVDALILAACLLIGLALFESVLFDTEGLKNYCEEREIIAIRREEKSFEKEVNKPGKHIRSVDKKREMANENMINSRVIASLKENDNVETVSTFNYPKSILESSDKVNNYDLFQNEIDDTKNDNEHFVELGVSDTSKDPYAELATDDNTNTNNDYDDTNMFGQTSITAEKLNYSNNVLIDENKIDTTKETAFLEEQMFDEDKIIESPQKTVAIPNEQDDFDFASLESNDLLGTDNIDFGFDQIDNTSSITNTSEDNFENNDQVELTEDITNNEHLIDKKSYKKWKNLQTIIILRLEQINVLYKQADQNTQTKALKKAQKDYNKKVKKANLLADKLNLQQEDYFKYIEITALKANEVSEEEEFNIQNIEQFDMLEAEEQIEQELDSEQEFDFALLETNQPTDIKDNIINPISYETSIDETSIDLNLNDMQEIKVNINNEDLEDEDKEELINSELSKISEEDHFIEQNFDEQEDIIPVIKVENANVFKFNEKNIEEKNFSNNDIFNDIERIDEQKLLQEDQQNIDQQQLIKTALNDEKWEQRFDLFDNRLTKLEKIMIGSSFQKIEKDKNFEKLHLDLNQIQTNLKKISGDVMGLEEKTQQISKAINNERSVSDLSKPNHTIDHHYPKVDDFNFNLSKYSLYNRSGYSNTYGTVVAQDPQNKYSGPRKVSDYNKIKSKAYSGNYANNENIEKLDYGHVSLHNISKYTKETVPFEDNCALCKKIKI